MCLMSWRNANLPELFHTALEWLLVVFLSLFGGGVRSCLKPDEHRKTLAVAMVSIFAGVISYKIARAGGCSQDLSAGLAGLAGLAGDELCRSILKLGVAIKDDPLAVLDRVRRRKDDK